MQQKAQDKFQKAFGLSWKEALEQGLIFILVDSTAELGRSISELAAEHDKLEKCVGRVCQRCLKLVLCA